MLSDAILPVAAASLAPAQMLLGLWLILQSAQWLVAAGLFAPDGRLPWAQLARVRDWRWLMAARRRMSVAGWRALMALQLGLGIVLLAGVSGAGLIACLAALLVLHGGAILLSGAFWADGSDKIGMIVLAGTLATALGVRCSDPGLALAGLLLVGGQLTLCYAIAGLSKLPDARWRDGSALSGIMATRSWGHPLAARLFARRGMAIAASWGVMLAEALFPVALFLPAPALAIALAITLAFHIATALVMGLNRFPWAFATAYPATLALGAIVARAIGWAG